MYVSRRYFRTTKKPLSVGSACGFRFMLLNGGACQGHGDVVWTASTILPPGRRQAWASLDTLA